ncbi:TIGR03985 family CRISPR-associated protein [Thermoleptolyngbya sp. C42_A2020_037]|uniref:TIGR03985 family CRISPR-associated protein n=1 Tax=Thermoleptolyngbya sp. C42_A2020_037 TaxID=2747799 RepID=UPI0019E4DD13|nr:TIGR03985 family CRISPR-associated protein [Thermoleptolyngbya sp. C42_A2020_037]MBF2086090.1 TIGR03985 family CRISPR-associated protein [Thermoleptolyngbya sp. C42_A2020_037]
MNQSDRPQVRLAKGFPLFQLCSIAANQEEVGTSSKQRSFLRLDFATDIHQHSVCQLSQMGDRLCVVVEIWNQQVCCLGMFMDAAFMLTNQTADQTVPSLLYETRLFAVTRRTLSSDLKILVDIHWLRQVGQRYRRVSEFPSHPVSVELWEETAHASSLRSDFLTQPDLVAIADNLSHAISGQRRFFIHLEYVVPLEKIDRVDEWQHPLQALWQQTPVPPLQILYRSAGQSSSDRASGVSRVHLLLSACSLHMCPGKRAQCATCRPSEPPKGSSPLDWRNYRLDRIESLKVLIWETPLVPPALRAAF